MKEETDMSEPPKYMKENVPYCPNCGQRNRVMEEKALKALGLATLPPLTVNDILNFFRNRVDRVHTHTFPENRVIGEKDITVVKRFKDKKLKPKKFHKTKPITEEVQKTIASCGLCKRELNKKLLAKRFGMVMGEDGTLVISQPEEAVPPAETPNPSEDA
jgi:hypothetical protein